MKINLHEKLSPHFTLGEMIRSEIASKHGISNIPDSETIERMKIVCCRILEPVRDHFGIPFSPNSGYRSKELNRLLRGSETSQHMLGQAVDFELPGISNYDLAHWVSTELIYDQLILENHIPGKPDSGWVHCSIVSGKTNRMQCLTIGGGVTRSGLIK